MPRSVLRSIFPPAFRSSIRKLHKIDACSEPWIEVANMGMHSDIHADPTVVLSTICIFLVNMYWKIAARLSEDVNSSCLALCVTLDSF